MTLLQRFEKKFVRESDSECWLWFAAKGSHGYGNFWNGKAYTTAHRVAYELYIGQIPDDFFVLHKCDVRNCVNPSHLFLGTQADNMNDKALKGRAAGPHLYGESNPQAKLSWGLVKQIRVASGTQRGLATLFGVGKTTIARIKGGACWKTV